MRYFNNLTAILIFLSSGTALAAEKRTPAKPPAVFEAVTNCRIIGDDEKRLACYDAATRQVEIAIVKNELYVVDNKQVRETRKSLFGFKLPKLGIFSGDSDDENQISELEFVVRSVQPTAEGWQMAMNDGSVWRQSDGRPLGLAPRAGSKVIVKNGAMGSFKAAIDGQPSVKIKRVS